MMKKLINKIFNRTFITFCIIGGLNTLVHLIIYNALLNIYHIIIVNTIAFIVASLFSYWANARFTYKTKMNNTSFWLSMLTFAVKLILNNALVILFEFIFKEFNLEFLIPFIPIPVTLIILPLQFLVFNKIFIPKNKEKHN